MPTDLQPVARVGQTVNPAHVGLGNLFQIAAIILLLCAPAIVWAVWAWAL